MTNDVFCEFLKNECMKVPWIDTDTDTDTDLIYLAIILQIYNITLKAIYFDNLENY